MCNMKDSSKYKTVDGHIGLMQEEYRSYLEIIMVQLVELCMYI